MSIHHHIPLVLASGSAVRAQMLKAAGLSFSVAPSSVDEDAIKHEMKGAAPTELAAALARAKALDVAQHYPDHLTIGADQLCVLGAQVFDKPGSVNRAVEQLQQLAGHAHRQYSAVCLARGQELVWQQVAHAELTMRPLSVAEIEAYVAADQPLKSCGAYCYELLGRHLFARVEGTDDVIKGLPMQALIFALHEQGAIGF